MNKKPFYGSTTEKVQISKDAFYSKGAFSNPNLFRTDEGHFEVVESKAYKEWKKQNKAAA
jgi:hypothetical protein